MKQRDSRRRDIGLERMAARLMALPFNRSGTDKGFVLAAMYSYNDYFSRVKRIGTR